MAVRAVDEQYHECCARCTARLEYARVVADEMGLRDWIVQVSHEPPSTAGVRATAQIAEGRRLVRLAFVEDLERLPHEERRHATVHELAHALTEDLWQAVRAGVKEEMGGAAFRVYMSVMQREIERMVDRIACAVAPGMPLPD